MGTAALGRRPVHRRQIEHEVGDDDTDRTADHLARLGDPEVEQQVAAMIDDGGRAGIAGRRPTPAAAARPLRRIIRRYLREPLADYQINPNIALVSYFMCAKTDEEARRRQEQAISLAVASGVAVSRGSEPYAIRAACRTESGRASLIRK